MGERSNRLGDQHQLRPPAYWTVNLKRYRSGPETHPSIRGQLFNRMAAAWSAMRQKDDDRERGKHRFLREKVIGRKIFLAEVKKAQAVSSFKIVEGPNQAFAFECRSAITRSRKSAPWF